MFPILAVGGLIWLLGACQGFSATTRTASNRRIVATPAAAHGQQQYSVLPDRFRGSVMSCLLSASVNIDDEGSSSSKNDDDNDDDIAKILRNCAKERSVRSEQVVPLLQTLYDQRSSNTNTNIPQERLEGAFELVFSSSVTNLPLVGGFLDGYFPNEEIVSFDFDAAIMTLEISTLPWVPRITVVGQEVTFCPDYSTLVYRVRNSEESTTWTILYGDESVVAFHSSKTGYNLMRRV